MKMSALVDKHNWVDNVAEKKETEAQECHLKSMYQLVKKLTGKINSSPPTIKGVDGEVAYPQRESCRGLARR